MRVLMYAIAVLFMTIGALFFSVVLAGVAGVIDVRFCIASPSQCPTPATPLTVDPPATPPAPLTQSTATSRT